MYILYIINIIGITVVDEIFNGSTALKNVIYQ